MHEKPSTYTGFFFTAGFASMDFLRHKISRPGFAPLANALPTK
jgi:hypothetical protein